MNPSYHFGQLALDQIPFHLLLNRLPFKETSTAQTSKRENENTAVSSLRFGLRHDADSTVVYSQLEGGINSDPTIAEIIHQCS